MRSSKLLWRHLTHDATADIIAVVAANDPFVMSGWARVEGLKDKACLYAAHMYRYLTVLLRSLPFPMPTRPGPASLVSLSTWYVSQ